MNIEFLSYLNTKREHVKQAYVKKNFKDIMERKNHFTEKFEFEVKLE